MQTTISSVIAILLFASYTNAFIRPVTRFNVPSSSRSRSECLKMEIPCELEGKLDPSKTWEVTMTLNGKTKTVTVSEETPLLEAAEEAFEDDVLYSCRSGVCNSCAGHLKGINHMVGVESLPDDVIEKGYVLTCTTHACGEGLHLTLNQQEEMLGIA